MLASRNVLKLAGFRIGRADEYRDHLRLLLFVRQARLKFDGEVNSIKFDVQYAFGGEEGVKNTGGTVANSSLGLLDFSADVPIREEARRTRQRYLP